VALASKLLPISRAKDAVEEDKRGRVLAVGPHISPAVEVDFFER
jgi:hypothetical protein